MKPLIESFDSGLSYILDLSLKLNREAQRKLIDDKRHQERRDGIKRTEKLVEWNGNTAKALLQMMQQMHQGNGQVQQQPSQVIAPVPQVVGSPPQQPPPYSTAVMVQSLNQIQLNEETISAKKPKQHHAMDYQQDHPKLTGGPQTANNNENPSKLPPKGGQQ